MLCIQFTADVCPPSVSYTHLREGVLLVRSDTTLADVRKFGEECQRRWGITPLQIFLHKDEGHWLNGQPEAEDRESFKVGDRWFKPN